ncbi:MAG: NAD-dependent epimerase/dehydratase family protein [Candidatus Kappaea frigidicola]|nr:NAD-dependent epimerase/dehydratase family protein [Candidatus Kappaea frigidicola]
MNVLITGAGSFVGYHLAKRLLDEGHKVLGLDSKINDNIEELSKNSNYVFKEADVVNELKVADLDEKPEVVYHLAAISSERLCKENPPLSIRVNVLGVINMLELAKEAKSLFVFSSSASVYPDSDKPKREEQATFTNKFYGTSKFMAEKYCQLYNTYSNVNCVIFRFSRIFGPRMLRNPIYDLSKGIATNQKIKLYESPESEYDFIYVLDVVNALIMSLKDNWKNKIINISSSKLIKLNELYETMKQINGGAQEYEVISNNKSIDVVDNSLAQSLHWKPQYSIEKALTETLEYYKAINRKE